MPLRMLRYLDLAVLALALPIFIAAGLPLLGYAGAAGGWLVQRGVQALIEKRARASDDPRTVAGLLTGSMIARAWIVAGSIFVVGLSEREAGLAAADPLHHAVHVLLHRPADRPAVRAGAQVSRRTKILLFIGGYLAVAIAVYLIFGSEGKNDDFKPQNEFKLEPWIELKIGGLDLSFNKAVLYLLITCTLTIGAMVYIARRMQDKPNRVQTVVEGAYDLTYNQIARNNMSSRGRGQVVPARGHAVLLHLVLEHARLHPAAGEQRGDDRRLRPRPSRRSASTRRRPTCRSRWC